MTSISESEDATADIHCLRQWESLGDGITSDPNSIYLTKQRLRQKSRIDIINEYNVHLKKKKSEFLMLVLKFSFFSKLQSKLDI